MKKKACLASPHLPPNENNKSQLILYICFSYHSKNAHKCSVFKKKIQKDGCVNEEFHSQKVKNKNTYFRVASGLWKFLIAMNAMIHSTPKLIQHCLAESVLSL